MEEPNPNAIYAQVDMALKHKNRRNSTSKREENTRRGDDGRREEAGGRKRPALPPQRPPPTPPQAFSAKKTPPPVAPRKPSSHVIENTNSRSANSSPEKSVKPLTLPKPPAIDKKASQVLCERKRKVVPPKPIPYHIYIRTKEKKRLNGHLVRRGRHEKNKENKHVMSDRSSDSSDSSCSTDS